MLELESGDIMACFGTDWVSRGISIETASPFAPRRLKLGPSHVAIISAIDEDGPLSWFESTTMCLRPCLVRHRRCSGAQCHPPDERVEDYCQQGGRVDVYRLGDLDQLTSGERAHIRKMLVHTVNAGLDYNLGGALVSGTRIARRFTLFRNGRLDDVFCSELIAAILQRRHRMNRANASTFTPARLLRTLVDEGTYGYSHSYTDSVLPQTIPFPSRENQE